MKQLIFNHQIPVIAERTFLRMIGLLFLTILSQFYFTGCVKDELGKKKNNGGITNVI